MLHLQNELPAMGTLFLDNWKFCSYNQLFPTAFGITLYLTPLTYQDDQSVFAEDSEGNDYIVVLLDTTTEHDYNAVVYPA